MKDLRLTTIISWLKRNIAGCVVIWLITQVFGELNDNLIIMFLFSTITLNIFNQVSLFQPIPKSEREIWGFEIFRFPGNLCRDPGKFFYINKGFSGTDIHHSDIKKMRYCKF